MSLDKYEHPSNKRKQPFVVLSTRMYSKIRNLNLSCSKQTLKIIVFCYLTYSPLVVEIGTYNLSRPFKKKYLYLALQTRPPLQEKLRFFKLLSSVGERYYSRAKLCLVKKLKIRTLNMRFVCRGIVLRNQNTTFHLFAPQIFFVE